MSEYPGREAIESKWASFQNYKGSNPVKAGTIAHIAKRNGWTPSESYGDGEEKPFKFVTIDELLKSMTPTKWLVRNYLEQNTMGLIFGDPGCGKSLIAIDIACAIATGTAWHGNETEKGAVFYIAGEGHNGLGRRFLAWQAHNNVCLESAPLYTSERAAQIYNEESAKAVMKSIGALKKKTGHIPRLIIIDTLARNFGGGDENSTKDMNIFIQNVDAIKDKYKATVLIVHHTGHVDKGRARGAMSLKGALDHEYKIKKDEDEKIAFTCTKSKEGPDPAPLNFKIISMPLKGIAGEEDSGGTISYQGSGCAPKAAPLSKQKQAALAILHTLLDERGKFIAVKGENEPVKAVSEAELKEALQNGGISETDNPDSVRTAIIRAIKDLKNRNIINTYNGYVWITDNSDNAGHLNFDDLT